MIIITGASGGIGASILDKLSKHEQIIAVYNSSNSKVKNKKKYKMDKV